MCLGYTLAMDGTILWPLFYWCWGSFYKTPSWESEVPWHLTLLANSLGSECVLHMYGLVSLELSSTGDPRQFFVRKTNKTLCYCPAVSRWIFHGSPFLARRQMPNNHPFSWFIGLRRTAPDGTKTLWSARYLTKGKGWNRWAVVMVEDPVPLRPLRSLD